MFEVHPTVDLRVVDDEMVALVQLVTTDDADEALDVVDGVEGTHHQFVRRYRLETSAAPDAVQSASEIVSNVIISVEDFV